MLFIYILSALIVFAKSQAVPAPGRGALTGYCVTSEHCKPNECCISFTQVKGKRGVDDLSQDLMKFVKGKCRPLGTADSSCYVEPREEEPGLYLDRCPCVREKFCKGTGMILPPLGESGVCRPKVEKCNDVKDCGKNECCASRVRPRESVT
ncbi:hypothetical protein DPMN_036490 [Dreissena polymorpha]|uniref:Uncharacterized protein n=1 Tax=Dreissena polymorpha TaxID=45954 RepID=A0A9D4MBL4_DREPO|nr:hypothetical protein DPMN_036490 [Dreissena polymorpha]